MHLRDHVRDEDVNMAIRYFLKKFDLFLFHNRVALDSFINAQKYSIAKALKKVLYL